MYIICIHIGIEISFLCMVIIQNSPGVFEIVRRKQKGQIVLNHVCIINDKSNTNNLASLPNTN